eukprot:365412-Chlamydomonas_euryale.AAC.23
MAAAVRYWPPESLSPTPWTSSAAHQQVRLQPGGCRCFAHAADQKTGALRAVRERPKTALRPHYAALNPRRQPLNAPTAAITAPRARGAHARRAGRSCAVPRHLAHSAVRYEQGALGAAGERSELVSAFRRCMSVPRPASRSQGKRSKRAGRSALRPTHQGLLSPLLTTALVATTARLPSAAGGDSRRRAPVCVLAHREGAPSRDLPRAPPCT